MAAPILTILISTYEDGILNMEKTVKIVHPDICYLVIHQTKKTIENPSFLNRADITVISSNTIGLSKSRNIGLENCKTDYALIADDDIEYIPKGLEEVLKIIIEEKPDFATFKIQTPDDEPEYKKYYETSFKIGTVKKHYYSSVEILLNVSLLKKHRIRFDQRFGLGAPLRRGEEAILIQDCVDSGFNGYYYPVYLVKHPFESSGKKSKGANFKFFFMGAFVARTKDLTMKKTHSKSRLRKCKNEMLFYIGVFYIKFWIPKSIISKL